MGHRVSGGSGDGGGGGGGGGASTTVGDYLTLYGV